MHDDHTTGGVVILLPLVMTTLVSYHRAPPTLTALGGTQ